MTNEQQQKFNVLMALVSHLLEGKVAVKPTAVKPAAVKTVKVAKAKLAIADVATALTMIGKLVIFESGFKKRTGILESIITGHYDVAWSNGVKTYTFIPMDKGHKYLALAGEPKRFRTDKVYGLSLVTA